MSTTDLIAECSCGQRFALDADLAGMRVECPACHQPLEVPGGSTKSPQKVQAAEDPFFAEDIRSLGDFGSQVIAPIGTNLDWKPKRRPWVNRRGIKRILAAFLLVVFAAALILSVVALATNFDRLVAMYRTPRWRTFTSPQGLYSVEMPSNVVTREELLGRTKIYYASCELPGSETFMVAYFDAATAANTGRHDAHAKLHRRLLGQGAGRNVTERNITHQGQDGKEMLFQSHRDSTTWMVHARSFVVNNRYYQLHWSKPDGAAPNPDSLQFMHSLRFTE